jgi:hypothetical protein
MVIALVGAALALPGCGQSDKGLEPAPLALVPGAAGPQDDELVALAAGKFMLQWHGQWDAMALPGDNVTYDQGPLGLGLWSPDANKYAARGTRSTGDDLLSGYLFSSGLVQTWGGRTDHSPLNGQALAVRYAASTLQIIGGLYQYAIPDVMHRLAYDRLVLQENVKAGGSTGLAKLTEKELPPDWPLDLQRSQAAFLGPDGAAVAVAGKGQVLRWDLGDNLTPCLTPEQVAAQGVPLETARGTILSVIAGAQGVPVYATCAAEGKLLVWKIPASGPAEFIGDAQKLAGGPIVQLAARPDGQQWAALIGGAASPAATDKSAPGQAGSAPPAPAAAAAVLYLTGPNFSSPQKVDLQGKAPADLAYSANGRLYFVVDSTQIWKITPGQPPAELAEGPPQDSLKAVTPK